MHVETHLSRMIVCSSLIWSDGWINFKLSPNSVPLPASLFPFTLVLLPIMILVHQVFARVSQRKLLLYFKNKLRIIRTKAGDSTNCNNICLLYFGNLNLKVNTTADYCYGCNRCVLINHKLPAGNFQLILLKMWEVNVKF